MQRIGEWPIAHGGTAVQSGDLEWRRCIGAATVSQGQLSLVWHHDNDTGANWLANVLCAQFMMWLYNSKFERFCTDPCSLGATRLIQRQSESALMKHCRDRHR